MVFQGVVMITRQIRVSGRVHGVGYRDSLTYEAKSHGVAGWVRNRSDGSVEAVLQGPPAAVDAVMNWARRGPRLAQVTELRTSPPDSEFDRPYTEFERWPTV
jgi:acylphosphatase